ncbi:MAG: serine hydrolase, partial [Actinomycetota bacterium]
MRAAPKTGVQYGKAWQTGSLPKAVSKKAVDTVVNAALGSKSNRERVRSVLIVKSDASGDKIVYEKYHPLDKRDQAHDTMSVSKSVTSALVGMLVGDGKLTLDQKAPVAAWSDPAD